MEIETKEEEARIIPEEKIDLTNSKELEESFRSLVEKDIKNITLDFKKVREIDSSALGKILLFNKIMRENEGYFKIKNVNSEYVKKVFQMVDLEEVVDVEE